MAVEAQLQAEGEPSPIIEGSAAGAKGVLKGRMLTGAVWTMGGLFAAQGLRLVSNLILTRLLFPEAFGMMALINVFLQGLQMFSDIGIGPSLIQNKRGEDPHFVNTAWTLQVIRGVALWICGSLLAWPFAWFYENPELVGMVQASCLISLIMGFRSTAFFIQNRKLNLARNVIIELATGAIGIVVMVVWALFHRSVWSLVAGGIATACAMTILTHTMLPGIRNRFVWDRTAAGELIGFGKWLLVSTIIGFFAAQLDRMILGRLDLSKAILGIYQNAWVLAMFPQKLVLRMAATTLLPGLAAHARNNRQTMNEKLLDARSAILPFGVLATGGLVLCSPAFFFYLYDARYHDAGWMSQLLAIYIWFWTLQASADRALLAVGDSFSIAISNVANVLVTLVGCLVGYQWGGMKGFILGLGASSLVGHAVIIMRLKSRGMSILKQDGWFTVLAGVVSGAGILIGQGMMRMGAPKELAMLLAGVLVLPCLAWWAYRGVRSGMRRTPAVCSSGFDKRSIIRGPGSDGAGD
jgi:O-antigen/teichoic acid export membrane protein